MSTLANDCKCAVRQLRRNPGVTVVIVLALSLGISVSLATAAYVDWFMHPPSSFPFPERMVHIGAGRTAPMRLSYLDYLALRDQLTSLSGLATVHYSGMTIKVDLWSREYEAAWVSRNFFSVAQVRAHLGHTFSETADSEGTDSDTVVLSYRLWKSHFGADPTIIGRTVRLGDSDYTVLGIAPPWFRTIERAEYRSVIDLWIPDDSADRKTRKLIGCLKSGESVQTLRTQIEAACERLMLKGPGEPERWKPVVESDRDHRCVNGYPTVVFGLANVILLIACLNVSGLLLAKANVRHQEIAMRRALGGSLGRLIRQLLTEGAVVAVLALGFSILVAYWLIYLLRSVLPGHVTEAWQIRWFSPFVMSYSLSITVLGTLLFELMPIWHACRTDLIPALRAERSHTSGRPRRSYGLSLLVIGQLNIAVILLVCAGLLLRSYVRANAIDLGFPKKNVLKIELASNRPQKEAFLKGVVDRVRTLAGVENVGLGLWAPAEGKGGWREYVVSLPEGDTPRTGPRETIQANVVDPGYFPTIGISILRGRSFSERVDSLNSREVIINKVFASRFWPDSDPVGRFIQLTDNDRSTITLAQVVGVVPDVIEYKVRHPRDLDLYVPLEPPFPNSIALLVETEGDPYVLADPIGRIIQDLDDTITLRPMTTLAHETRTLTADQRFMAQVMGVLAVIGMSLASVGLYSLIAFAAGQRTHEVGIRMALGARRQDIMRMVVGQGLKLCLIGLGLGLLGSLLICQILRVALIEMGPYDPVSFAGASLVLLCTALLASYLPARRAAGTDPMDALRHE